MTNTNNKSILGAIAVLGVALGVSHSSFAQNAQNTGVQAPRDAATGQASGKRIHGQEQCDDGNMVDKSAMPGTVPSSKCPSPPPMAAGIKLQDVIISNVSPDSSATTAIYMKMDGIKGECAVSSDMGDMAQSSSMTARFEKVHLKACSSEQIKSAGYIKIEGSMLRESPTRASTVQTTAKMNGIKFKGDCALVSPEVAASIRAGMHKVEMPLCSSEDLSKMGYASWDLATGKK